MDDLPIKNGIVIPGHELEVTTSRAGGPGGQHVNKTNSRVTIRWNVRKTLALDDIQKERVLQNLQSQLTSEGDVLVHSGAARSLQQNKELAREQLAHKIKRALYVPKKRIATDIPEGIKADFKEKKKKRSEIKKMRSKKIVWD